MVSELTKLMSQKQPAPSTASPLTATTTNSLLNGLIPIVDKLEKLSSPNAQAGQTDLAKAIGDLKSLIGKEAKAKEPVAPVAPAA